MHSSRCMRPFLYRVHAIQHGIPKMMDSRLVLFSRSLGSLKLVKSFVPSIQNEASKNLLYSSTMKKPSLLRSRQKSDSAPKIPKDILLYTNKNGVATLTMNQPKKLNGWTGPMMLALKDALLRAANDDSTKVAILTGADPYYCAGVNLSDTIKPMHPAKLHQMIFESNSAIFNCFIDFQKPLIIAANGPAIGACFTSATLADCIIASEKATFSTPFARLGVPPEGCSSVHFERIMGKQNADRMLGTEGWVPTAAEAKKAGFVKEVVAHEKLVEKAQEVAEQIITSQIGKVFAQGHGTPAEYKQVNMEESRQLADAFLAYKFLDSQYNFLKSKGKGKLANVFWVLKTFRPLWSWMIPKK